ncbi:MAG: helix-turn-helix domain-containing protein, partial [Olleya sp.]
TNVINFNLEAEKNQPDESILQQSKTHFQLSLISEIFDFYQFLYPTNRLLDIYYKNRGSFQGNIENPLTSIKDCVAALLKVANGFKAQLLEISKESTTPETSDEIQSRFKKALAYYKQQLDVNIIQIYKTFNFTTDNKTLDTDFNKQLDTLEELIGVKQLYFSNLGSGFSIKLFLELRAKAVFLTKEKPKTPRKTAIDGTTNVELFELLRELRNTIAEREDLVHFQIFTQKSLYEMCETLPTSQSELLNVNGFGKTRVAKYGNEIIQIIREYCEENDIEVSNSKEIFDKAKPKRKKRDTKETSLQIFKAGKSIDQIAFERDLNVNTIFEHLASFIPSGEVKITDLISEKHYKELKALIPKHTFENLSDLKSQIADKYSYGEIRLVLDDIS